MTINDNLIERYGINSAIVIQNFAFWINLNKQKNNNFKDGAYWTYSTLQDLNKRLKFL